MLQNTSKSAETFSLKRKIECFYFIPLIFTFKKSFVLKTRDYLNIAHDELKK